MQKQAKGRKIFQLRLLLYTLPVSVVGCSSQIAQGYLQPMAGCCKWRKPEKIISIINKQW